MTTTDIARVVYAQLKGQWLQAMGADYARQQRTMVPPLEPWQIWRIDPRQVPPLVFDEDDRPVNYIRETVHTKFYPHETDIRRQLRFRPAIIISDSRSHGYEFAWTCPLTREARGLISEVEISTSRHAGGVALLQAWRSVSTETSVDDRELLCFDDNLRYQFQAKICERMTRALAGDFIDPNGPKPGDMVRATPPYLADFEGVVVAGWQLGENVADSAVVVCQLIPSEDLRDLSEEEAARRGMVVLRDPVNADRAPFVFSPIAVRTVACRYVSAFGEIKRALIPLKSMILERLAAAV
jgi:hypothetical protein